ncbi:phospholipid/cholesterol/gamma-HCH transport system substrate-binding protein [Nocardia transvalensis]|uniref:Phospholipid/cholesterol/gamma-HCH transport system substrate-binding protein n=1 Tax=Nocardia transvalensis TaxID=37333 RepID=A0A7W9PKZ7_9NOCA|nr:MlaD family protein [Nocardia transvalensis]MBB5917815.1 phospholipid/cholesterol/gamma-HCH transport system substrate-binding protein [Nocardia transvalensis]
MSSTATTVKAGLFAAAMLVIVAALVVVFGQFRFDSGHGYRAEFTDVSGLKKGDFVRVAGVEVGRVAAVGVGDGYRGHVELDVDDTYRVTSATRALVRYQNLVGDRYLELQEGPGDPAPVSPGYTIPLDHTAPALDLDLLIGSFQPLFRGLDPVQINNLSGELIAVLQGQGGTVQSLLVHAAALTSTLADRDQVIGRVVANLDTVLGSIDKHDAELSSALDTVQQIATGLARDSDAWGQALDHIDRSTAALAGLLADDRPALAGTVGELGRTADQLNAGSGTLDSVLGRLPDTYAALTRLGAYGNFFNYYLCGLRIQLDGPDGASVTTPLIGQTTGRCAPK